MCESLSERYHGETLVLVYALVSMFLSVCAVALGMLCVVCIMTLLESDDEYQEQIDLSGYPH